MFIQQAIGEILTQGDLIDDCPLVGLNLVSSTPDAYNPVLQWWPARLMVLTQACDLAQAKVDAVLVAPVHDAQRMVAAGMLKGPVIRDQVRRHLVFGWYFLPAQIAPVAMPESLIDLRAVHSVPRIILEQLIAKGQRVATLTSPYREHLGQHFAVTYMRVALPEPYATQP